MDVLPLSTLMITSWLAVLKRLARKHGHCSVLMEPNKLRIYYSKLNNLRIDVWPYVVGGDGRVRIHYPLYPAQPADSLFPARLEYFDNFDFPVYFPRDPIAHLDAVYGKDKWQQELTCKLDDPC